MIKRRKKKNPVLQLEVDRVLNQLDPEYIFYLAEGDYSEVYEFKINENKRIDNIILKKGLYVIKFLKQDDVLNSKRDIPYLKKLSKLKIIPKIYVITEKYIIMDLINGETLRSRLENTEHPGKKERLIMTLEKMIQNLHDKGIAHGDLHSGNILIDKDDNLYIIDPLIKSKDFRGDELMLQSFRNTYLEE